MAVVIIVTGVTNEAPHEDPFIWGPFTNAEQAVGWAYRNLSGHDWHWLPLERPGSTYQTCDLDDLEDFAKTAINEGRDCYVTIDDVNWVVLANQ